MASVYRRGKIWVASFRGADGRWHAKSAGPDKSVAVQIANKMETENSLRREGFITPAMDTIKTSNAITLDKHIEDWRIALSAKANTPKHVGMAISQVTLMATGIKAIGLADLTAQKVGAWLADKRTKGLSVRTSNAYLTSAKTFCRWAVRDGRATVNPLEHLQKLNDRADRRHDRRAFSDEEVCDLIQAAENSQDFILGLSGADRAMAYRIAAGTGFRANEIRSLTPASFALDTESPTITIAAGFSKHRRQDVQPIHPDLAAQIAPWLATKTAGEPVLKLPEKTHTMIQRDMEAARKIWLDAAESPVERAEREKTTYLAYWDGEGHYADFHALRHTYISNLAAGGVHPRTAQQLARHSTITLTMDRYTHIFRGDIAKALDILPKTDVSLTNPNHGNHGHKSTSAENALKAGGFSRPKLAAAGREHVAIRIA